MLQIFLYLALTVNAPAFPIIFTNGPVITAQDDTGDLGHIPPKPPGQI